MVRPFRFGYQLSGDLESDPVRAAQTAEQAGFDTFLVSDHVGTGSHSPLVTLGMVAQATAKIRLGTLVLNNEMRNPLQLAWELSSLDRLSGGRIECGLGAGHTPQEFIAAGITMSSARERKARLAESVEILRALLAGQIVNWEGAQYSLANAQIDRSLQERIPILVGGNGPELLGHAGKFADIIGLQGLGRTHADGHRHDAWFSLERLETQIDQVREGAQSRFAELEINALVQMVVITETRESALRSICDTHGGLDYKEALVTPYLLVGTINEIVAQLHSHLDRFGISYFAVRDLESFVPILNAISA